MADLSATPRPVQDNSAVPFERKELPQDIMEVDFVTPGSDISMREALDALDKRIPISGRELCLAIMDGIADHDGAGAGLEFEEVRTFVQRNCRWLSDEALNVFREYKDAVTPLRQVKETKIPFAKAEEMFRKMEEATGDPNVIKFGIVPGFNQRDPNAGARLRQQALEELNRNPELMESLVNRPSKITNENPRTAPGVTQQYDVKGRFIIREPSDLQTKAQLQRYLEYSGILRDYERGFLTLRDNTLYKMEQGKILQLRDFSGIQKKQQDLERELQLRGVLIPKT